MGPLREADQFVDRSAELAVLDEHRVMADDGRPSLVLLRGEAGVGKTRLLAEFTAELETVVVVSGSCLPIGERGLPLAPFVEAFRAMANDPSLRDRLPAGLDSLLFHGTEEPVDGLGSRSHLFQSVLDLIDDLARAATTMLIIEDLHWADQSTRDLIDFIVPNLRSQRLLIAASYRPDHVGRHHDLRSVVAELARHPHVTTLDVPPFLRQQVRTKLEHLLDETPADETIDRVLERTGGNAYFIEELVAADRIRGDDLPESLRELLLVRADVVSPMAQRLLRVASLVQVELEDWLLADVADEPLKVVRRALHEAIDARLLVTTGGRITFQHALLQEALRNDLLIGERAELHRAYARAVGGRLDTSRAGRAERTAQLAFHAQQAGDTADAIRAWIEAADAAEAVFAFAEAHQHLNGALTVWDIVADAEELTGSTRVEVLARAADDAFLGGAADDACRLVRLAIDAVSETKEPRLAGTLQERLGRSLSALGDRQGSMAAIERAVELVPGEPPSVDRARVLAGLARQLMYRGRLAEARTPAAEAFEMAQLVSAADVEADALNTLGALNFYVRDGPEGLTQLHAAGELAERIGDTHQQMRSIWNLGTCYSEAGQFEESLQVRQVAIEVLPRLGHGHMLPKLMNWAAETLTLCGRTDEAETLVDEALQRFSSSEQVSTPIALLITHGDFDRALRLLDKAAEDDRYNDDEVRVQRARDRAEVAIWQGDLTAARAAIDEAVGLRAESDRPIMAARAFGLGVRCEADIAHEARRRNRGSEVVDEAVCRGVRFVELLSGLLDSPGSIDGWKRRVAVEVILGSAERSRLDDSPTPARWQEAAAAASELPLATVSTYALAQQAEAVLADGGDRATAAALLVEAREAAGAMRHLPLLDLVERIARRSRIDVGAGLPPDDPFGLTPRERDVLDLIATGASNRQIAEALFISEKTASVHVSNIIRKLQVTNRGEAASVAYRSGLVRD